jgi:hypothetical protein
MMTSFTGYWLPARSSAARVDSIVAAPSMSNDPLLTACKDYPLLPPQAA